VCACACVRVCVRERERARARALNACAAAEGFGRKGKTALLLRARVLVVRAPGCTGGAAHTIAVGVYHFDFFDRALQPGLGRHLRVARAFSPRGTR